MRQARGRPTSSSSATLSASIVVAEGVEEAETLATLASLGCDLAQGYYIARPTAAADLTLAQRLVPWARYDGDRDAAALALRSGSAGSPSPLSPLRFPRKGV